MKRTLGQLSRQFHKENKNVTNELRELLLQNPLDGECLNMMASMAIGDTELCQEILTYSKNHNLMSEQIYTSVIRSYINNNMIDQALSLIKEMIATNILPHVRTFIPFYQTGLSVDQYMNLYDLIKSTVVPTCELFSLLVGNSSNLSIMDDLIEWAAQYCNTLDDTVMKLKGKKTTINDGVCQSCQTRLKTLDINNEQRQLMLTTLNNPISKWCQTRHYDIVIDGANVAHSGNEAFDQRKVITLVKKLQHSPLFDGKKILVVFSNCRRKQTQDLALIKGIDVFYVKGGNDDLSWLYAALYYPNILCITNDQMRDHVYYRFNEVVGRNVIDIWMEQHIVPFRINNNRIELDLPLEYSVRPQVNHVDHQVSYYHLPLHDGTFYCYQHK